MPTASVRLASTARPVEYHVTTFVDGRPGQQGNTVVKRRWDAAARALYAAVYAAGEAQALLDRPAAHTAAEDATWTPRLTRGEAKRIRLSAYVVLIEAL